jgi:predicted RNA-binding Zn ribbon-like protein
MPMDWTLSWLGYFPLAVDVVNSVIPSGGGSVDLLSDEEVLEAWLDKQRHRLPIADSAKGRLAELRKLRRVLRDLLYAAAENRSLPDEAIAVLNEASAAAPYFPTLEKAGRGRLEEVNDDPFVILRASIARSAINLVSTDERKRLSVCHAPSCGLLFMRDTPRQLWCTTACGNRARVAGTLRGRAKVTQGGPASSRRGENSGRNRLDIPSCGSTHGDAGRAESTRVTLSLKSALNRRGAHLRQLKW